MNKSKRKKQKTNFSKTALSTAISLCLPCSLIAANFDVTLTTDDGTGNTAGTLSYAILQANTNAGHDTIILNNDVMMTGVMQRLINSGVTIKSNDPQINRSIDGNNLYRPLFIKSGLVILQNLTIENGLAQGGSSEQGGPGAGMGGGLFIYDGTVFIRDVEFSNSRAEGAVQLNDSSNTSGGGGILGNSGNYGGGGLFASGSGDNGGYGGTNNYNSSVTDFGKGGSFGGTVAERNGGFGGGGAFPSGHGGFGGGAAAPSVADNAGNGGFGGASVYAGNYSGTAGYGASIGDSTTPSAGAGMGGAVFVRSGGVVFHNVSFNNNSADASHDAKGLGGAVFVVHSTTNSNNNNQGMPSAIPTFNGCGVTFSSNSASGDSEVADNNDDIFYPGGNFSQITDLCPVTQDLVVTVSTDNGLGDIENTLSWAIKESNSIPGKDFIRLETDVVFTGVMKRLINSNMTIHSDHTIRTISGDSLYRPLFIKSGEVLLQNMNLNDGVAMGGNGNAGGAGMGGALFIYDGDVEIKNISFNNNAAIGGVQNSNFTGGGGMYGSSRSGTNAGGGGLFASANSYAGAYGGFGNYRPPNDFGQGSDSAAVSVSNAENGGFGGGGGSGFDTGLLQFNQGNGGFGGGSGKNKENIPSEIGGFGGGANNGNPGYGASAHGSGMGGAVFVRSGTLDIQDSQFNTNTAYASNGANGLGGGLFVLHSTTNSNGNNQGMPSTLANVSGCGLTFSDNMSTSNNVNNQATNDMFDLANRTSGAIVSDLPMTAPCSGPLDLVVTEAQDDGSGLVTNTLSWAIKVSNTIDGDDTITLATDVTFTGVMKRLIDSNMTIQSDSTFRVVRGGGAYRPLFIKSGTVVLKDFEISHSNALGGNGAGAGAGMGGALFIYDGDVELNGMTISGSIARGRAGGTDVHRGGGSMYRNSNSKDGAGLFSGNYGGYGNYQSPDIRFGQGGVSANNVPSLVENKGGFGAGGAYGFAYGHDGGFGGGGGASNQGTGGLGGFGAGGGAVTTSQGTNISPGYGGDNANSAGMGGGLFIRTGNIEIKNSTFTQNRAISETAAKKLGGAIFVVHTTMNSNGNDQGMPSQLSQITACDNTFDQNTFSGNVGQNDIFDPSNLINPTNSLTANANCVQELQIEENNVIVNSNNAISFGTLQQGDAPIIKSFEIKNNGLVNLSMTGNPIVEIADTNQGFSISQQADQSTLSPGSSDTFDITFNPVTFGNSQTEIEIQSNDPDQGLFKLVLLGNRQVTSVECSDIGFEINTTDFTFTVDSSSSLVSAIHCANLNPSTSDTIVFSGDITLNEFDNFNQISGNNGTPQIKTPMTIDGNGYTLQRNSSLACNNDDVHDSTEFRLLYVEDTGNLDLKNMTLANGCITGDLFSSTLGLNGAGLFNLGEVAITNVQFSNNKAVLGAGILNSATITQILNSTFNDNQADFGGGVFNEATINQITNSTFSNNTAISGGAVLNFNTLNQISNSTFSGNNIDLSGAPVSGIENFVGAGIFNFSSPTNPTNINNNLFHNNSGAHADCFQENGEITGNTNLSDQDSNNCTANINTDLDSTTVFDLVNNSCATPLANGFCTATHALSSISQAIDATLNGTTHDQRGFAAIGNRDIGAYEVIGPKITAPADIITEATGPTTAIDLGSANVSGDSDGVSAVASDTGPFAVGVHAITWSITNQAGVMASDEQRVEITDNTAPTITINGDATLEVEAGSTFTDPGATASDIVDGDISANIVVAGAVDTSTVGPYELTYNITDTEGNAATQVTRTVLVVDNIAPIITIIGEESITVDYDSNYKDQGATANDNVDGDISANIAVSGMVDTNTAGEYQIKYNVSDSSGNPAIEVTRNVTVSTNPDIIYKNGFEQ